MDNLLESNERTLVLFDAVCSGLTECLALVHADLKQMTEHRNKLAQLEQEQLDAKLSPAQELIVVTNNENIKPKSRLKNKQRAVAANGTSERYQEDTRHKIDNDLRNVACEHHNHNHGHEDDPHHLAGLKMLDKRLADSFSHALSLNDLQKSSIAAKQQANSSRPSIFQVLLGKTIRNDSKKKVHHDCNETIKNNISSSIDEGEKVPNNKMIEDINRQTRLAMQYSKQLESNLFRIEDLRCKYEMHLKMGLVVKSVSRAYLGNGSSLYSSSTIHPSGSLARRHCSSLVINDSSSLGTRSSLSSLNLSTWSSSRSKANNRHGSTKTTIKEFIENIDKIEAEFETFMGSFLIAVEDIQGFARVCQGDVFEITIKYGDSQKFKTKISVLKDNRQKCDNRQTVFKARLSDVIAVKAYECKGLGKRVLLGHKLCETKDLFTARSQLMTISLNQTGSIKLNLIVTWNPLHLSPNSSSALPGVDISHISLPPTPVSSSTLSSLSSVPSLTGMATTTTINIQSQRHPNKSVDSPQGMDKQHQHNNSVYQTVDPTFGYYIPPVDYLTNDQQY